MVCPKCGKEIDNDDKFCHGCGWNTQHIVPTVVDTSTPKPRTCPACGSDKIDKIVNPVACPVCGEYLGFNRGILDRQLVQTAKIWTLRLYSFYADVLGLSRRVARTLANQNIQPLAGLALNRHTAMGMRGFGEVSYNELDNARNNWKPKEE